MRGVLRIAAGMLAMLSFLGCSPQPVPVQKVVGSMQCRYNADGASLLLVDDAVKWEKVFARTMMGSHRITPALPVVDFTTYRIALILLGEKPTAGYTLALADKAGVLEDGELRLGIVRTSPLDMAAQVVTHPCLAVQIPREGYETVGVYDQEGEQLLYMVLPRD